MSEITTRDEIASLQSLPTDAELDKLWRLATGFAKAGVYKDVKQAEQAIAKLIIGRDLGLTISQSMQGVQFVQGQIQLHYSLLALIIKARGYTWKTLERSSTRAAAQFIDPDGNDVDDPVEFTMEDAERAGLTKPTRSGEPSMYAKYPRNMLWARMMADAVRFVIPEATGGVPVYVPGEIPESAGELTEGEGTGEARGVELPSEVEEVIARADLLGHLGWAERATWEYRADRGAGTLAASVREATDDLDELEAKRAAADPATGEVVEPDVPIANADLPEPKTWAADEPEQLTEAPPPSPSVSADGPAEGKSAVQDPAPQSASVARGLQSAARITGLGDRGDTADPPTQAVPDGTTGSTTEGDSDVPVSEGSVAAAETEDETEEGIDVEVLRRRLASLQKLKPKTPEEEALRDEEAAWIEGELSKAAELQASKDDDQGKLI